jgi:acetyl esterase/lipase
MMVSRRDVLTGVAAIPALGLASKAAADYAPTDPWNPANWTRPAGLAPDMEIDLWPEGAIATPDGLIETVQQRSDDPLNSDRILEHTTRPRLAVFLPEKPNSASVIIAPGGGYRYAVIDKEGYEIARLLAARGVTAFVLFYRMPDQNWMEGRDAPLADAQRAVRVVRQRAAAMNLNPARVAMMGFSAGGHVAASLLTRHDAPVYTAIDAADGMSAKPDAGVLIYPVIAMDPTIAHIGSRDRLIGTAPSEDDVRTYSPNQMVAEGAPPTFLLFAEDDPVVPVENGICFRAAMKAAGADIETHLFAKGGHGFGLRKTEGLPVAAWPELLWRWMQAQGLV